MPGKIKPDGIREFNRFPKHCTTDYVHTSTNEQSLCFIPNDDIQIIGFLYYRMKNEDASYHQGYVTEWKIRDSSNKNTLSEGSFPTFEIEYSQFPPDENKIIHYKFTNEQKPIPVLAGQQFHIMQQYYHRSYSEKFYYGEDGEQY